MLLRPVEVVETFCSFPLLPALLVARPVLFVLEAHSILVPLLGPVMTLMFPGFGPLASHVLNVLQRARRTDHTFIATSRPANRDCIPAPHPLLPLSSSAGLWSD